MGLESGWSPPKTGVDFSRPGAEVVKGASRATGVKEDTIKKGAMVIDPMGSIIHGTVTPGEAAGYAGDFIKGLTETAPVYTPRNPDMIAAPTIPTTGVNSAAVTVGAMPTLSKTSITPVSNMAGPNFAGSAQATKLQGGLAEQLAAQTRGEGPSLATEQLKQAQANNLAATFSMMASQRGGPTAAGTRGAMSTAADINAQSARDAAMARIKEQTEAQGLLAGTTASMRSGDVSEQKLTADINQANLAKDLQLAVEQGKMDERTAQSIYSTESAKVMKNADLASQYQGLVANYTKMGLDAATANQRAQVDMEGIRARIPMAPSQLDQIAKGLSTAAPFVSMVNPAAGAAMNSAPGIAEGLSSYDERQNQNAQANTNRSGTLYPTR